MVLEVFSSLGAGVIIIGIILVVLIATILILSLTHRKLQKKLVVHKTQAQKFQKFYGELEELRDSKEAPTEVFKKFDKYVKQALTQKFQLPERVDYSSMKKMFTKLEKNHLAQFCDQMLLIMYSGDDIDKQKLDGLIKNFEQIVREERLRPISTTPFAQVTNTHLISAKLAPPNVQKFVPLPVPSPEQSIASKEKEPEKKKIDAKPIPKTDTKLEKRKRRSFWSWLFGKKKKDNSPKPIKKPVVIPKGLPPQPKTPAKVETPKKKRRSFWQWLFGNNEKKKEKFVSHETGSINFKEGEVQNKEESKLAPPKKKDALPDLQVPTLPSLVPKDEKPLTAQVKKIPAKPITMPKPKAQKPAPPIKGAAKPLPPKDGFVMYTVKKEIARPAEKTPVLPRLPSRFEGQKQTNDSVKKQDALDHKQIESVDNMDRIKERIKLIRKLRKEANLK